MTPPPSYFWYDLETSGIDPKWHRVMQFGGVRTDLDLNIVGDELNTYVKLPIDVLPDPTSCLITGLTPQLVNERGIDELEFHSRVDALFSSPNTCVVGFNNLRFDDEFMRYGFYRHLFDPYAREWREGNSRWDVIDLLRAAHALRPDGLTWPRDDEGLPAFRLEGLSAANSIRHERAHDAFSDVHATIALARMIKLHQPRLFDFYLRLRQRNVVRDLMALGEWRVFLHVSGRLPRDQNCLAPVVSITAHPRNQSSIVVADLTKDVTPLLEWDVDRIREALFTRGAPERPALKEIRMNRCPFVAPFSALRAQDKQRLGIDVDLVMKRRDALRSSADIAQKIADVYTIEREPMTVDVDAALYEGFWNDADKERCARARAALLAGDEVDMTFDDPRLPELVRRIRGRVFFDRLTEKEKFEWAQHVGSKLSNPRAGMVDLELFRSSLAGLSEEALTGSDVLIGRLTSHAQHVERFSGSVPEFTSSL